MFKFVTITLIALTASVVEGSKLHANNKAALMVEGKEYLRALETLQHRLDVMEKNGEDVDFDLGSWLKDASHKANQWFKKTF